MAKFDFQVSVRQKLLLVQRRSHLGQYRTNLTNSDWAVKVLSLRPYRTKVQELIKQGSIS